MTINNAHCADPNRASWPHWPLLCAFLLASCGATPGSSPPPASLPAIEIRNGPDPGSLELAVHGTVELAPDLMVEQQLGDGSFQPVRNLDLGSMKLVASCDQLTSTCVKVDAPGFRPIAWSGMSCSSQCNHSCDKNVRLYGRYRFVVQSCDGKTRFEGPVFELPETH